MLNLVSQVLPAAGRVGDVLATTGQTSPATQEAVFLPQVSPGVTLRNLVGRASVAAATLPGVALAGDGAAAGDPLGVALVFTIFAGSIVGFSCIPGSDQYHGRERSLQNAKTYDNTDPNPPVLGDAPFVAEYQMWRALDVLNYLRSAQQPLTFSARVYLACSPNKNAAKMQAEAKALQTQVESKMLAFWQTFAAVEPQTLTSPEQKTKWLEKGYSLIKLQSRDVKGVDVLPVALAEDLRRFRDQVYKPALQTWLREFLGDKVTALKDPQDIADYLAKSEWLAAFCDNEIFGFRKGKDTVLVVLDDVSQGQLQAKAQQLLNERVRLANKRHELLADAILAEINPLSDPAELEAYLAKHQATLTELSRSPLAKERCKNPRQDNSVVRLLRMIADFRAEQQQFGKRTLEDYILD